MTGLDDRHRTLPPLYTGQGDAGRTTVGTHEDVAKTDVLVAARGDCDEANAAVSVAMAAGNLPIGVNSTLASVQNDLFDLIADLASRTDAPEPVAARIQESHLTRLERAIDHFARDAVELTDLDGLVLPGGTVAAALPCAGVTSIGCRPCCLCSPAPPMPNTAMSSGCQGHPHGR
jgi:cob(I)alamin adenosyltransferase